jgi:hypothetical protein
VKEAHGWQAGDFPGIKKALAPMTLREKSTQFANCC